MTNQVTMPHEDAKRIATETLEWIKQYREFALDLAVEIAMDCRTTEVNLLRWFAFKSAVFIKHRTHATKEKAFKFLNEKPHKDYFSTDSIQFRIKYSYSSTEYLCEKILRITPDGVDSTITLDFYDADVFMKATRLGTIEEVKEMLLQKKDDVNSIYKL